MDDIFKNATDYRKRIYRRAVAHELSAEYHRRRGVQIGVITTIISAIVGSTVFLTVLTQLGLDGKGTISVPSEGLAWLAYIGFGFLSILAPVLTGLQTYLNYPDQAARHKNSSAGYYELQMRLDSFLSRYKSVKLTGPKLEEALKELKDISTDMEKLHKDSISLTARAYKNADAQIGSEDYAVVKNG